MMAVRYLFRRGSGARRRVMHIAERHPITGDPTMMPLCGRLWSQPFDTTSNVPLGGKVCVRCRRQMVRLTAARVPR